MKKILLIGFLFIGTLSFAQRKLTSTTLLTLHEIDSLITASGGSASLSSLTAATTTNNIDNTSYAQNWKWDGLAGTSGLFISSLTTQASGNNQRLFRVNLNGANAASSETTYASVFENGHSGTASTNVAGYFSSYSGTNNYAIIVPSGGGSVGIGTSTPDSLLHNAGSFHQVGNAKFDANVNVVGAVVTVNNLADTLATKAYARSLAGGSGSTNTSVGSGYKVAIDGTNNIKSLTGGYGITLDSATSNQVGIKADTATLFPAVRATIPAGGWGLNGTSISYGNFLGTTSNNTLRFYTNGVYRWKIDSSSGSLHNGTFTGNNASVAPITITADAQEEVIHTYSSSGINAMTITKDGFKGINYIGTAISGASALKIKASATSATAHASSIIDIESTSLGFLQPRMTTTQRNAISSPATGLQIFNTTDSSINVKRGLSGWYTADLSLTGSAALDFGSTSAQTSADLTITVTGAADGDVVSLGVPNGSANANTNYTAWVSAANTVTVRFNNYSSGAIDPASGTFKVRVIK